METNLLIFFFPGNSIIIRFFGIQRFADIFSGNHKGRYSNYNAREFSNQIDVQNAGRSLKRREMNGCSQPWLSS